jgi:hypothetical protein
MAQTLESAVKVIRTADLIKIETGVITTMALKYIWGTANTG